METNKKIWIYKEVLKLKTDIDVLQAFEKRIYYEDDATANLILRKLNEVHNTGYWNKEERFIQL